MYYFIVNPNARRGCGGKIWKRLERRLKLMEVEHQVYLTTRTGDARSFARELTESGGSEAKIIVAVGGDGTVNEVLDGLSFKFPITLGYIPTGSGNDLAKSLRLPRNPFRCLKKILTSNHYKYMDYGVLSYGADERDHRRFAVSCGIGLDAAVCHGLLEVRKRKKPWYVRPGRFSYVALGIGHLATTKATKGYVILDGVKRVEFNHIHLIATNIHPYASGGFRLAPRANFDDGNLEVCVIHGKGKRRVMFSMMDAFLGRMKNRRGVRFYSCRELQIHMDQPMPVHVDGENCMYQTDIHVNCIEKKLRIIV